MDTSSLGGKPQMPSPPKTRTIGVSELGRVEGKGSLHIRLENGELADLRLEIFEAPRFFEAFHAHPDAPVLRIVP